MVHVTKGSRAYMPGRKAFGEVIRTSLLGTDALIVSADDGTIQAFCGDDMLDSVVDKDTKKNGRGVDIEIPTDVKTVGPAVLEAIGLDEDTRTALFQKFMVLDEDVRLEKASYWEENQADSALMAVFLPELMALLGEDTLYIQTQSLKLLAHLDQATRDIMLAKFMTETTAEERKALIIKYSTNRNDKFKTEEFLQGIYSMLLDDVTYLRMEFLRALGLKGLSTADATVMIDALLENAPESKQTSIISAWRKYKMYRTRRGKSYAYNQCRRYKN